MSTVNNNEMSLDWLRGGCFFAGAAVGGVAGFFVGGPVGALVGAMALGIIGMLGTYAYRNSDALIAAGRQIVQLVGQGITDLVARAKAVWDQILNPVIDGIKSSESTDERVELQRGIYITNVYIVKRQSQVDEALLEDVTENAGGLVFPSLQNAAKVNQENWNFADSYDPSRGETTGTPLRNDDIVVRASDGQYYLVPHTSIRDRKTS